MIENFFVAIEAVAPLFCLMSIGGLIKHLKLMNEEELKHLNKMLFKVFFCIMLFYNIYLTDFHQSFQPDLIAFCVMAVILTCAIASVPVCALVKENPTRGAMIHGIYRSNFLIMGVPMVANIFGQDGIGVTTMLVAIIVPLYNILGVIVLETFRGGQFHLWPIVKGILKNPMIIGTIAGAICNLGGITIPTAILRPLGQVSAATTPMALIVLGASFTKAGVAKRLLPLAATVGTRLLVVPSIILPIAYYLGYRGVEFVSIISIFCTPCAIVTFTMAQQMDSDGELAGNCVIFTSALSCFTLFGWIFLTKTLGLF